MDCETCTERLVDLVQDELDEAAAEATRAHLEGCEACAATYARLTEGQALAEQLPRVEPPPDLTAAILAAARERNLELGRARRDVTLVAAPPERARLQEADAGPLAAFLRWLGGLAMGPQVAMATLLLLMVGLGLWALPELRRHAPTQTSSVVDPVPGDEVGPSATTEERLAQGRVAQERLAQERLAQGRVAQERLAQERGGSAADPRALADDEATTDPAAPPVRPPELARAEARQARRLDLAEPAAGPAPTMRRPLRDREQAAPPDDLAAPATEALASADRSLEADEDPTGARSRSRQGRTRGMSTSTASGSAAVGGGSTRSAAPSNAGMPVDGYAAEDVPAPALDGRLLVQGLHERARQERRQGNCAAAVRTYEELLRRGDPFPARGEAMLEVADCYRRLGRFAQAESWLLIAAQDDQPPSIRSRARRTLIAVQEARRGAAMVDAPAAVDALAE
ncbi:MAG: tetratricopeptide repeat protein [Sandaracinaceae bacterium]